ncbi:MAG: hypothetical protein WBO36_04555 [Saprospiraceae bacterium]
MKLIIIETGAVIGAATLSLGGASAEAKITTTGIFVTGDKNLL